MPLTSLPGEQTTPALSPDGKQVAFVWTREHAAGSDLYVKLVDGGEQLQLTSDPDAEDAPTWSPDGTRFAFLQHVEAGCCVIQSLRNPTDVMIEVRLNGKARYPIAII